MLEILASLIHVLLIPGLFLGLLVGGLLGWSYCFVLAPQIDILIVLKSSLAGGILGTILQYTLFKRD